MEQKTPCFSRRRVSFAKKPSTALHPKQGDLAFRSGLQQLIQWSEKSLRVAIVETLNALPEGNA